MAERPCANGVAHPELVKGSTYIYCSTCSVIGAKPSEADDITVAVEGGNLDVRRCQGIVFVGGEARVYVGTQKDCNQYQPVS